MGAFIDLTGHKYGRWTVLELVGNVNGFVSWKCKCDCGNEGVRRANTLRTGGSKSCGCYHKERAIEANITHGMNRSPEHMTWMRMIQRCYNPNVERYPEYGGRGIRMSERWVNSFETFFTDMGPKPSDDYSIERIDVNGNYEPGNCRWATTFDQSRNRRNNQIIEYQGQSYVQVDLCDKLGIAYYQLRYHINHGRTSDEAIAYLLSKKSSKELSLLVQQEEKTGNYLLGGFSNTSDGKVYSVDDL